MNSTRIWLVVSAVAAIGIGPLLVHGDADQAQRLQQNRQHIAALSEADRARLLENFEAFQKLSDSDRNKYLQLHQQLETDRQENHGEYARVFDNYIAWLRTISPDRREELRNATDAAERMQLMQQVVNEQHHRRMHEELQAETTWIPRLGQPVPVLNSDDLAAVMRVIEERLGHGVNAAQRAELEALQGVYRHLKLMMLLSQGNVRLMRALTDDKARELLQAVQNSQTRQMIEANWAVRPMRPKLPNSEGDRTIDLPLRIKLTLVLWASLERELQQASMDRSPDLAEQRAYFDQLPEEAQRGLLELGADDFHAELHRRMFNQKLAELGLDRSVLQRMLAPERPPGMGFEDPGKR